MFNRSRSLSLLTLLLVGSSLTLGPVGCASHKPREKWWQFWRPKKVDVAMHHPDQIILPPPPGVLEGDPNAPIEYELPGMDPSVLGSNFDIPKQDPMRVEPAGMVSGLMTVHFSYDSSELDEAAKQTLENNLRYIQNNPGTTILIEGHCDERGTHEYNLSLGERRANAVKAYLVQRGAPTAALHTISYGEERPLNPATSDSAWSENRRAQFLVY